VSVLTEKRTGVEFSSLWALSRPGAENSVSWQSLAAVCLTPNLSRDDNQAETLIPQAIL